MTVVARPVCRSCGATPQEGARFCAACGSALVAALHGVEFKQVTVLFADVVESMHIAAALNPERFREVMTELVERSAAVVRRYGGTVEYAGDGVMALFGAPVALEDHAFRACLAALAIQEETSRLAAEVARRDGVALRLRVGLNSGRVIAGEIGTGALGYRATGEPVGLAQRMQSVAPPGGVMLSESTARLVEHVVMSGDPELLFIKGFDEPVRARRLVGIKARKGLVGRAEVGLVGRRWEMAAVDATVDRAIGGSGGVVGVVGSPGIGKSRLAREAAALATGRGVKVLWSFCESHVSDVSFHVVRGLLRNATGIADLDGAVARARVREQFPAADPQDLLLLNDLLGVGDPDAELARIDPDARRRRLTALINTASLARAQPALFIVEDVHWIDEVSESMLADFVAGVARTSSMVLITYRPDYVGVLTRLPGAQTITLAPLCESDIEVLIGELLGSHRSVGELAVMIAERAAGNPFFAEEMVRELAQRGVLTGERGHYVCRVDVAEVSVPATVQATIEARIDRLDAAAKRTVNAASVIGARFGAELLAALGIEVVVDEPLSVELIDQIRFSPSAEYAFRHPLIRAVAYESQLNSDRAELHRRVAAAIESRDPAAADQYSALIAEHLEAAGDLHAAYQWHMRAATWASYRDIAAARQSWARAQAIADTLPAEDPSRTAMRIAPRTMLCITAVRVRDNASGRFAELRELCSASGDKASLAVGMTGPALELLLRGRAHEASRMALEQMELLELIGNPTLTIGVATWAISIWFDTGEIATILRWSQTVIGLTGGDPTKGSGFGIGSPLAVALASRGVARWWLGHRGWRQDLDDAVVMARNSDPVTHGAVAAYKYGWTIKYRVLRADDAAVLALEEAVTIAEGSTDNAAVGVIKFCLGVALMHRDATADHQRGLELLLHVRETWLREPDYYTLPVLDIYVARERARSGDREGAIPVLRKAVDDLHRAGRLGNGVCGAGMLVETLLDRGTEGDVAEAQTAVDRLANLPADEGLVIRDIWLLRLRALLARARGDDATYRELVDRYRAMATELGFEGHIAWAEAM